MTWKVFGAPVVLLAVIGFFGLSQAQDFKCALNPSKCEKNGLQDVPGLSPQIPLNEYRRNKLSRLEEFLRNKRNRVYDDAVLNEE